MCCSCHRHHTFPIVPYSSGVFYYPYYACFETPHPSYAVCPYCSKPFPLCRCSVMPSALLPKEIAADTGTPKSPTVLIGGSSEVKLTLEYMPDPGQTSAAIALTITGDEGTSTVKLANITPGYHVKDDFAAMKPGSTVMLEVKGCTARLRWCEVIACG